MSHRRTRRSRSLARRRKLAAKAPLAHGQRCPFCRVAMIPAFPRRPQDRDRQATVDHILPRCRGGSHAPENLRWCCKLCNQVMGRAGHCAGALACALAVHGRAALDAAVRPRGPWRPTSTEGARDHG